MLNKILREFQETTVEISDEFEGKHSRNFWDYFGKIFMKLRIYFE